MQDADGSRSPTQYFRKDANKARQANAWDEAQRIAASIRQAVRAAGPAARRTDAVSPLIYREHASSAGEPGDEGVVDGLKDETSIHTPRRNE